MNIPEMRWLIKVGLYTRWDSRDDEYSTSRTEEKPILQYMSQDGGWVSIPEVYEEYKR